MLVLALENAIQRLEFQQRIGPKGFAFVFEDEGSEPLAQRACLSGNSIELARKCARAQTRQDFIGNEPGLREPVEKVLT